MVPKPVTALNLWVSIPYKQYVNQAEYTKLRGDVANAFCIGIGRTCVRLVGFCRDFHMTYQEYYDAHIERIAKDWNNPTFHIVVLTYDAWVKLCEDTTIPVSPGIYKEIRKAQELSIATIYTYKPTQSTTWEFSLDRGKTELHMGSYEITPDYMYNEGVNLNVPGYTFGNTEWYRFFNVNRYFLTNDSIYDEEPKWNERYFGGVNYHWAQPGEVLEPELDVQVPPNTKIEKEPNVVRHRIVTLFSHLRN